jgi:hypothetical protein
MMLAGTVAATRVAPAVQDKQVGPSTRRQGAC